MQKSPMFHPPDVGGTSPEPGDSQAIRQGPRCARANRSARSRGFTLIELMVGLTIFALLMLLGAPTFGTWMQNSRIRTTAEAISEGLQFARGEAVTRNTRVRFQLTSTLDSSCAPSAAGQNWVVNLDPDSDAASVTSRCDAAPSDTVAPRILRSRPGAEGSGASLVAASQPSVVFNGVGRPTPMPAGDVVIDVSNPAGGDCQVDGGPMTCLRLVVSPVGQIHMCNPSFASTDPQGCPP